jgi:hypothetical protein
VTVPVDVPDDADLGTEVAAMDGGARVADPEALLELLRRAGALGHPQRLPDERLVGAWVEDQRRAWLVHARRLRSLRAPVGCGFV